MDLFDSPIPDYNKPLLVISSCKTLEQLVYAEKYVQLFIKHYNITDEMNDVLTKHIFSKKMKLKNGWGYKN